MNVYEFLEQINIFYPSNKSDKDFITIVKAYAENILYVINKNPKRKYDYRKILNHLLRTYKYKTFPPLPEILASIPYGEVVEIRYSGEEGREITRSINGHEYSFTVVSSNWDVRSITELDKYIAKTDT